MYRKILTSVALLSTMGCASGQYSPPTSMAGDNTRTISLPYNKVWQNTIDFASKNFFGIDNFEKDSGLLTLSFGAFNASKYVDCGTITVTGAINFSGSYVDYITTHNEATLEGRMNIVAKPEGNNTSVTINTRYVLSSPARIVQAPLGGFIQIPAMSWTFTNKNSDTSVIANPLPGTPNTRTCQSTGIAEQEILNGINISQ